MKNRRNITLSFTLLSIISFQQARSKFSFSTIRSLFSGKVFQQVINKEFAVEPSSILLLENINGNITIKSVWKHNKVALKAIKKVKKKEDMQTIVISSQQKDNKLILKTVCKKKIKSAVIDYELVVPADIKLHLVTKNGFIRVNDITSPLVASTNYGSIETYNTKGTIKLEAKTVGSVIIHQAKGNVYATTKYGSITIDEAQENIIAKTNKGKIQVSCSQLPNTGTINLETKSGPINLALPSFVNATIQGQTNRGILTSDHYLRISHNIKLNRQTRARLKKEVYGMLGSGEASIRLSSGYGNIKILQTKTSA